MNANFIVDNFDEWKINYSNKNLITKYFKESEIKDLSLWMYKLY